MTNGDHNLMNVWLRDMAHVARSLISDTLSVCAKGAYDRFAHAERPRAYYEHLLAVATNYEQWAEAAKVLDDFDGLDQWKQDPQSRDYDWELIKARLAQLVQVREQQQSQTAMIFALRTSLARNLGDMGNPKLYSYSRVGTKALITAYMDEVCKQLNWICDEPSTDDLEALDAKHEFFVNVRQSFGRTALLLSGGGTLGLHHLGVLKCLHQAKLLPRIISGASSGSIMAALLCTKTSDEITEMFDPVNFKLDVFERRGQPETPWMRLTRLLTKGQLYDVDILTEAVRESLGDMTFQEAFNRTRWILNITVSSSTMYDMPRLLNYLTAPDVLIWSAVAASCAVPVFYGSSPLYAKDKNSDIVPWSPNQLYIDGSVENDLPMNKLSELFNVNHFIVCQVNPHVIPFLQKSNAPSLVRRTMRFCMNMAKAEAQHRCTQLTELGIMPSFFNMVHSVISQKYSGDITIVPEMEYDDFIKVLSNPTPEHVSDAIIRGEHATWPKMSIIKNHLQIELTIDAVLYRLRLRRLAKLPGLSLPGRPVLENRSCSHVHLPVKHQTKEQGGIRPNATRERATSELGPFVKSTQSAVMASDVLRRSPRHGTHQRRSIKRGLIMTPQPKDG